MRALTGLDFVAAAIDHGEAEGISRRARRSRSRQRRTGLMPAMTTPSSTGARRDWGAPVTETPEARRHLFNLAWTLKRIVDILTESGTQNANGEWRVVHFTDPLGHAIEKKPRRR
jgi:hypothetical protein